MERQNPLTSRGASAIAMAVEGYEDPFPPRWLNVRCVIRHGTFAETNAMGEMRRLRPFRGGRSTWAMPGYCRLVNLVRLVKTHRYLEGEE